MDARGPGFHSLLRQGFFMFDFLFCCCCVFTFFVQKHIICRVGEVSSEQCSSEQCGSEQCTIAHDLGQKYLSCVLLYYCTAPLLATAGSGQQ